MDTLCELLGTLVSHKTRIHNAKFNIVIKNGYASPNIWAVDV